jgi:hypothetical protein
MKPFIVLGACTVALLLGCSTVSVNSQWRDHSFAGPPLSNVLVVGITRSDTMKRVFEDVFSQELLAAGIRAERSYARLPQGATSLNLNDLKATGIDGVLTTRVERIEQKINVTPSGPSYGGFYGWYGSAWASTPDVNQYEVVTLETSVWDVKSEKLVWTVTTQGVRTNDLTQATKDLASTLIPKLKGDGVLR